MASFTHQLKVLLWKNCLSVYRQPVWTVVLILWPAVIFVILAIIRPKFPPQMMPNCYLAPRPLQSAGLIPFMKTFLCTTDTTCSNSSYTKNLYSPRSTNSFRKKRYSADTGGGGSSNLLMENIAGDSASTGSRSVVLDMAYTAESLAKDIAVVKAVIKLFISGDIKGALCLLLNNSTMAQQSISSSSALQPLETNISNLCNSDKTMADFVAQALLSQAALATEINNAITYIQKVQSNTALWDFLLMLPEWYSNPFNAELAMNISTGTTGLPDVQPCFNFILTIARQVQNGSYGTIVSGLLQTLTSQSPDNELKACISLYQWLPCEVGTSQCWPEVKEVFEISYWLVTSLNNGTNNNACTFNGTNVICDNTTSLEDLFQSTTTLIRDVSEDTANLLRITQLAWEILKQNKIDKLVLQKLQQEIAINYPGDFILQNTFTELVDLLLNVTDSLMELSMSSQHLSINLGTVQKLLEQFNVPGGIMQGELINISQALNIVLQTIGQKIYYVDNLAGILSSYNVSIQTMTELQYLIQTSISMHSDLATIYDVTTFLKIVSILNQPEYSHILQAFQTLLDLDSSSTNITTALFESLSLLNQVINMWNTSSSSLTTEVYLKQITNFILSDSNLLSNLLNLNMYINGSHLSFLQSDSLQAFILDFLTPSKLQNLGPNIANFTSAIFKTLSTLISPQDQEIIHKIESATLSLLNSVTICEKELGNCTRNILEQQQQLIQSVMLAIYHNNSTQQTVDLGTDLPFQVPSSAHISVLNNIVSLLGCFQQNPVFSCNTSKNIYKELLDAMPLIANVTLTSDQNPLIDNLELQMLIQNLNNIQQVLGSVNLAKLLDHVQNVVNASGCYNGGAQSLQCSLEMFSGLINLFNELPFPQPLNDTLTLMSSIAKFLQRELEGVSDIYQHLTYMHNFTQLALQNGSVLHEIHISLTNIVQTLEEIQLNWNSTTHGSGKFITNLLEMLQSSNIINTSPTSSLKQTYQELEDIKKQLMIIQWYVFYVKNETENVSSGNIYPFVAMTQLIVNNTLSSMKTNPFFAATANEIQYILNVLKTFPITPSLHNLLNAILERDVHNLEQILNHTVSALQIIFQDGFLNGTYLNTFFSEPIRNDTKFLLSLLQWYDPGSLANQFSSLIYVEQTLLVLQSFLNDTDVIKNFNNNTFQSIYNLSKEFMIMLYNAEHIGKVTVEDVDQVYKLLLQIWNTSSMQNVTSLEEKLKNILYLSMQCISENILSNTSQNCSVKELLHSIELMLNDSGCQVSLWAPYTKSDMNLNTFLKGGFISTLNQNMTGCSTETTSMKEGLVCFIESLGPIITYLSRTNIQLGFNITWVQQIDESMTVISKKLVENNITCTAIDGHIVDNLKKVFDTLDIMASIVTNQTQNGMQYSESWNETINILKFFTSLQEQDLSNDNTFATLNYILPHLLTITSDSTNPWLKLVTVLETLGNLSTTLGTSEQLSIFPQILSTVNKVASLSDRALQATVMLPTVYYSYFFNTNSSVAFLNVLKQWMSGNNVTSAKGCDIFFQSFLASGQKANLTVLETNDELFVNISTWTCSLIFNNDSIIDWAEELKSIIAIIVNVESTAPTNVTKFAEAALKIITSFKDFVNVTSMDTFDSLLASLSEAFKELVSTKKWIVYQAIQNFVNSLKSLVNEALMTGNDNHILTAEKVTLGTIKAFSVLLKSLNVTGYENILSFTSEVAQVYFNIRNRSLEDIFQTVLTQIVPFFQNTGFEKFIMQTFQSQLSSYNTENLQVLTIFQKLMTIVLNTINGMASEKDLQPPYTNTNIILNMINTIVGHLNGTLLQETSFGKSKNITDMIAMLISALNAINLQNTLQQNNVSFSWMLPQNETSQTFHSLEVLLNNLISKSGFDPSFYFNSSSALVKILYHLYESDHKEQLTHMLNYILNSSNPTEDSVLVGALGSLHDLIHLNHTNNQTIVRELYLKQLLNFLSDSKLHKSLMELSPLLNLSQTIPFISTKELRDFSMELLELLHPLNLYNIGNGHNNLTSVLVHLLSSHTPQNQGNFRNITIALVTVIEILQQCNKDAEICISAIPLFQNSVEDIVDAFASFMMYNGEISLNTSLVQLEMLDKSEISLINHVFLALWYAQEDFSNFSGDILDVYQQLLSTSKLIMNITRDLNVTTIESDLGIVGDDLKQIKFIMQELAKSNMMESLLQIINIQQDPYCLNQTDDDFLLCTFNLTSHFLSLLQNLDLSAPLKEKVEIMHSLVDNWMREMSTATNVYHQIISFYEKTKMTLQNEPTLHTLLITLSNISLTLEDIKMDNMTSISNIVQSIKTLTDLLQPDVTLNPFTVPVNTTINYLEKVQVQLDVLQWYLLYIKNQTGNHNASSDIYPMYRLTQTMLSNMILNWVDLNNSSIIDDIFDKIKLSTEEAETLFNQLIQLFNANQSSLLDQKNWPEISKFLTTMKLMTSLSTSTSPVTTTIWQIVDKILVGEWNMTYTNDILKDVQTVLTSQNVSIAQDFLQAYYIVIDILNLTHSAGNMNFTLNSFSTMDCPGLGKLMTVFFQAIQNGFPSTLWPDDVLIFNLTADICDLFHWNNSQDDWAKLLQVTRKIVASIESFVPDNSSKKYFVAAEKIITSAAELVLEPFSQATIASIMNIVPAINEFFGSAENIPAWTNNITFQHLFYVFLDLATSTSSPKEILLLKLENFILETMQPIQDMLTAQNDSSYNIILSFSLEAVKQFINMSKNTSLEDNIYIPFLKQMWALFRNSSLEDLIISKVALANSILLSKDPTVLEHFLQLMFRFTDLISSETSITPPYITIDKLTKVLQTILGDILTSFLPQSENITPILDKSLQAVLNVTRIFLDILGQNKISQFKELIGSITSMTDVSNDTAKLVHLFSLLNQTGLIPQIDKTLNILFNSSNMEQGKLFLDALDLFYELIQMKDIGNIHELSSIFMKYLPSSLENGNQTQKYLNTVLDLLLYFNRLSEDDYPNVADGLLDVLPLFLATELQHLSNEVINQTSRLLGLIAVYMPVEEQDNFQNIANISLQLIESINTCRSTPDNCTDLTEGIQNIVRDIIHVQAMIKNGSFEGHFANSSLLQTRLYDTFQKTLINDIYLLFSYSLGHPYNSSEFVEDAYDEVLAAVNWILNTSKDNQSSIPSSLGSVIEVLTSANISEFIFQTENVVHTALCIDQEDIDPLLCSLDLTYQLTQLLKLLPWTQSMHDRLSIISSVAEQWLSTINVNISVSQQLNHLYNATIFMYQHKPILHAINTSVVNIIQMLQETEKPFNVIVNRTDTVINLLSAFLQVGEFDVANYNLSDALTHNTSNLLESIRLQLDVVQWVMLQVSNKTALLDSNVMHSITQQILNSYQYISPIIQNTHSLMNSFNGSFSLTGLIHLINSTFQNEQVQLLINQAALAINNSSNVSFLGNLIMNGNIQRDSELALYILQEFNHINLSMVLSSIDKAVQVLQTLPQIDLEHLHLFHSNVTVAKVYKIVKEGMGILNNIQEKGSINKEMVYRIYKFTYLLAQDEWDWIPFQNISTMEAELLDVWFLAMSPFLGGTEYQEHIGNCSAQDVLNILVQTIFNNATGNESIWEGNCHWQYVSNSSDTDIQNNHTLSEMIYLALQSYPVFHNICKEGSLHPLAGEMACLLQLMEISVSTLASLNNASGLHIPVIQSLNDSLAFICDETVEYNTTFHEELHLLQLLDQIFLNQSNPIKVFILFFVDFANLNIQTSDFQINWAEMSNIMKILATLNGQVDSRVFELIEKVINITHPPNLLEPWNVLGSFLSMNWTASEINDSISILDKLRKAIVLGSSGLEATSLQIYQALVTLLKTPNITLLFNMGSHAEVNASSVIQCDVALNALFRFSDSVWVALDPQHSSLNQQLLSNISSLACRVLDFQSLYYTWNSDLPIITQILPYVANILPSEMSNYFTAAKKIISLFLGIPSSMDSTEDMLIVVFELLIEELRNFNSTNYIADWLEVIPLRSIYSFLKDISSNFQATVPDQQITITDSNILNVLLEAMNANSYPQALSSLSQLMTLLPSGVSGLTNITQQLLSLTQELTVIVPGVPFPEPYSTVMHCLKNTTQLLTTSPSGHLEGMIQLIQDVFTQRNELANASMIPHLLKEKLYQLQNLTNLVCGFNGSDSSQSCFLACQYNTLLQNILDLVVTGIESSATVVGTSSSLTITTVTEKMLQFFEDVLSSVVPLDDFQDVTLVLTEFFNITSTNIQATIEDLFHNSSQVRNQLRQVVKLSPQSIEALMTVPIPENKTQIIYWFVELAQCSTNVSIVAEPLQVFCSLPPVQGYQMAIIFLQNVDVYKMMYRLMFPQSWQENVDLIVTLLKNMTDMFTPPPQEIINKMIQILDLSKSQTSMMSRAAAAPTASFMAISKYLCQENYTMLAAALNSLSPTLRSARQVRAQNLKDTYGIPDENKFCFKLFSNMVTSTSGANYWMFLKPMLYGQILYTPHTVETEKIMQKTNNTLQELWGFKDEIDSMITYAKQMLNMWPLLQIVEKLQSIISNPFVSTMLEQFLDMNITELSVKLNYTASLIDLMGSESNNIRLFVNIADVLSNLLSCLDYNRIHPMNSSVEMMEKAKQLQSTNNLFAAVTFDVPVESIRQRRDVSGKKPLPKKIKYSITMRSLLSEDTTFIRDDYWIPGPHNSGNKYSRGFVYLQENIERAIIEIQTNQSLDDFAAQYQPMPYPCYKKDEFLFGIFYSFPIGLMIAWVLFVAFFVKKLVHDKEMRLHEYMKMMGVNSYSHFFAWFIECVTYIIITVTILVIILKVGKVLPNSNGFILFLFFLDYGITVIAMSYLISVFFHNTSVAALSGSLIYIITFFPFIALASKDKYLSFAAKTLLGLFSPTALCYSSQFIVNYEQQNIGIQWHNLYSSPKINDSFSCGWLCWIMVIDSLIYFIVGAYIRTVFPGKYGIGAPWYFPVLPSYWSECCGFSSSCSRKPSGMMFTNIMAQEASHKKDAESNLSPNFEPEPTGLNVGVSLHGLTKVYQSKAAVQNLNLTFYEGHITALLGHNGAGKTTTLSMLTGLFSATSGTIHVYGEDINTNLDKARRNMGVCMQYDVLFDYLTTKEHLLLYGSIKAPQWTKSQLHEEVKRALKDTGLYKHRHKPVKALSGGMRRKLSISIALIGGSKVVILDEPTTGVDPCSRRSIWEVISRNKMDKTIILSTHHLDEAEVLSDRIAFLEQGGLKCCGSPMFLKDRFGSGYHLTLTKKYPNQETDRHCNPEEVKALIQSHIPEARLKEDVGGELIYILPPFKAEISGAYLSLLRALDTSLNDLNLGYYGISDTTIEEVFLKLTDGVDDDEQDNSTSGTIPITNRDNNLVNDESSSTSYSFQGRDDQELTETEKIKGVKLTFKKIMAIFIKRFHHSKRDWKGVFSQIILPVLFVIAAMGLGSLSKGDASYPELLLSPNLYGTTEQVVAFGNSNKTTDNLISAMLSPPGIDNICMDNDMQCLNEDSLGFWNSTGNQKLSYGTCNCSTGFAVCGVPDAIPPHRRTYSRQMLYNVTGHNMEQYLLTTTLEYIQKRYGGWSFGTTLLTDKLTDILQPSENVRTATTIWYNPEGRHSLPTFLNSFNNFLLRAHLPSNESDEYGIFLSNKPLPGSVPQSTMSTTLVNTLVALSVFTGYSITTASFATYVVKEHHNGSKRLQHIAGVGEVIYWLTHFLYDLLIYFVPVALSIAMIAAFQLPAFYDYPNLGAVSLLFILFGYATFAWMYLLADAFRNPGMAFIVYVCINLVFGISSIISTSVVHLLMQQKSTSDPDYQSLDQTYHILLDVFKIFPQFCFGYGLIQLSEEQAIKNQLSLYGNTEQNDVFKMDILGWMLTAMAIEGTFCLMLRLLINNGIIFSVKSFFKRTCLKGYAIIVRNLDEDDDVKTERERIESGKAEGDLLQLQGLTKVFYQVNKKAIAVNNMTLGIPPGECFGLLGVNGAGKTTTFKMLTGDIIPSKGNIQVRDQTGNLVNVLGFNTDWSAFGYCPQEDALDELMTGEEHLYYYARIHGIPEKKIKYVCNRLLYKLHLVQYKDRITANYSCGTRRKLSTALALVGKPSILLLDEPSSGMDPKTKRHLWKIISEEVKDRCAVVLTSHSMEECEALCTRLAIMVKGKFQCIGSLQHIKSRFGSGFTVKMHLKDSSVNVEAITDFMRFHFPNTCLKDQHFSMVEYHVPVSAGGVASIFEVMELNKANLDVIHFSVSQTTLDEVFIHFAQPQASPDNSSASSQEFNQVVVT